MDRNPQRSTLKPMKRRKHATYVCLGAGCSRQVRMRVSARRPPKRKPPMWRLVRALRQDADTGVLRETTMVFCSERCEQRPQEAGGTAATIHRYLGAPGAPPTQVTYSCLRDECDVTAIIVNPKHRHNEPDVPEGWQSVPMFGTDYDTGIARVTTLATCSEACLHKCDGDAPREEQPAVVQRELTRLYADIYDADEEEELAA